MRTAQGCTQVFLIPFLMAFRQPVPQFLCATSSWVTVIVTLSPPLQVTGLHLPGSLPCQSSPPGARAFCGRLPLPLEPGARLVTPTRPS